MKFNTADLKPLKAGRNIWDPQVISRCELVDRTVGRQSQKPLLFVTFSVYLGLISSRFGSPVVYPPGKRGLTKRLEIDPSVKLAREILFY